MLFRKNVLKTIIILASLGLFALVGYGQSLEGMVNSVNQKAKNLIVPNIPHNEEAIKKAQEAYQMSQSPVFKMHVEEFKQELKAILRGEKADKLTQYYSQMKKNNILSENERIYIFVSSSMPETTIRNYIKQASKIGSNIYFVMRGTIGGIKKITPTAQWITSVIKKDPYCEGECEMYPVKFLIDPFLYKKYNIQRVPAVVYVNGLENPEGLSEGLNSVKVKNFFVSYGDVSLEYHLKLIGERAKNENIKNLALNIGN